MKSLLTSLSEHPLALLRGIAGLNGVSLASNVRADAAAQLAALLCEPETMAASLANCSPEARAAWQAVVAAGRRMKASVFARAHGDIRPIGPGRMEREETWLQPQNPAEELWYRGLIFRTFADLGDGPLEYVYIPDDLGAPADAAAPLPAAGPRMRAVPAPPREAQAFNSLAVDVCSLLAALRDAAVPVDRRDQLRPADSDRLRSALLWDHPVRFGLALSLARGQGWTVSQAGELRTAVQAATAWLRATPWEQMTALFVAWRDSRGFVAGLAGTPEAGEPAGAVWNDLRRVPSLQAEGDWRNDPMLARRSVLEMMRNCEPAAWYAVADLVAAIKAADPDFQRPDGDYSRWYLRDAATGRYLDGFESWDAVEGRLIHFLVTAPLYWLGAVALDDQATRFRLTPAGTAWLNASSPAELPRPARLTVNDDFTVAAPLLCPLLDRFRLLRFTEPVPGSAPAAMRGAATVTRHRISRTSLARARDAGVKPAAILAFLQHATDGRVPARVVAALTRWEAHVRLAGGEKGKAGIVRISKGAILRVGDASVLAALRADPTLAPLLGELLSAQAVLVSEANLSRVLAALVELGYTPKVD